MEHIYRNAKLCLVSSLSPALYMEKIIKVLKCY